ncbi:MAG: SMC-Scp complex subunit ScpB [Bdellovibrionales bacterium RIFOXYD12_FULL_39_22]|nr:MAG: SMC-Scp complex subunit ScpB [Bdellovibrionales bacterium RIFOXYB1_FULL_39_21]OFZ41376.1 MAG: SMC-Scp complex subunit ScpB [Bdellovibrionales bacterium RIFOXYC12_FULL_39_17]OFZ45330.1 MAG: SMC-Scp complex subunit ScpB [Bdellovibrionales bacterium RIFOXYC1_FULL_39_130]OFZ68711.1 MAG: SMC-Scp complex subunit ScpB [Bdellovibrionales bacterium RIFOXYC2_FULL_39_8]OFZ74526.1 MAG: SMC-Scp complex subunit ScpB [Bdellovibrionales bacterium RIFOXYD1_FULL_39_84]OFZ92536.1 MAG: SMC-Scp complex sub
MEFDTPSLEELAIVENLENLDNLESEIQPTLEEVVAALPAAEDDQLWRERTGLNDDSLCGAIETIIFMSDRPVSLAKIKGLIDNAIPLRVLHDAILRLQNGYETTPHGIRLVEVADGYQFRTKATYSKYVQDLFKVNSLVLTPTALEVLAIVAYKQPIARNEVDAIRGVDSSHIVRALMEKRLIKIVGKSDDLGRPVVYGTTPEFLEVFNLADISHLPPEHELEAMIDSGIGQMSDIQKVISDKPATTFFYDEIDELDSLSNSIKSISSETPFTKSLKQEDKKRMDDKGQVVKSAFDLLEEYLTLDDIQAENKQSILSNLLVSMADPKIVSDLQSALLNAPLLDEMEDEDFAMIDLETGEKIEKASPVMAANEGQMEVATNLFESVSREEITTALDSAFSKLIAEQKMERELANQLEGQQSDLVDFVEEKENDLERLSSQINKDASEYDLDLSFLDKTPENNVDMSQT